MIPENWRQVSLSDVCDRIMVGLATSVTKYYRPNGVPIIRNQNITESGFNDSDMLYLEPKFAHSMPGKKVRARDVITVHTGYIGISCVVPNHYDGAHTFTTLISSPKPKQLDSDYLAYHLNSHLGKAEVNRLQVGGGRNNLNVGDFIDYQLLLPPLPEQRKIAEILGTWDEAIRLTADLIAAKQQRKKGLMQRLLTGEVRFPEFAGRPWREAELAEITEIIISNVDKKLSPAEKSVRLCNYTDVFKNAYIRNSMTFMEGSATPAEINRFGLQIHDVIITKDSETAEEIAEAAVVIEDLNNVICGYHLAILRPDSQQVFGPFLSELLHHGEVRQQFVRKANGITRYGLTQATIREATFRLPQLDEQIKISMFLQACDHEIDLLQQKLAALQQQKKGLMQRLLTGQVRVTL